MPEIGEPGTESGKFVIRGARSADVPAIGRLDKRITGIGSGAVRAWEFGAPPNGWVFALAGDPAVRLRKIGSRLFDAICACLAKAGVDTVRTMLARDDSLNMAFFRSQGMMGGPFIQLEMPLDPPRDSAEG